jgi:L-iditol 2-dehydrogenase
MKCLLLETVGHLRPAEIPPPKPARDEILLRVSHCAVCRTDAKMWHEGHRDLILPRVLGHEICGWDETCGSRFVVWPGTSCGECAPCRTGLENLCRHMSILGFHRDGGFAERVSVPTSCLIPIPETLPGHLACFAEPLSCALNALEQINLSSGMTLLIYGGGTLGLLMAMAARALGVEPFLVETNIRKLDRSRDFRASLGISGSLACDGGDYDAAINAAASPVTFLEGIFKVRPGGCFCLFSGFSDGDPIATGLINEIHYRQLHLVGAYGCTRNNMERALILLQRYKDDVELLIENRIELEQVPDMLPAVLSGQVLKFVVVF